MRDPADPSNTDKLQGAAELAEWVNARATAARPPVELTPEVTAFVVPAGYEVKQVDVSALIDARAEHPRFRTGAVTVNTVDSFIDYVKRHKALSTTLWVQTDGHVVAVMDDHEGNDSESDITPGWGRHRATLKLVKTPSWQRWENANNSLLEQETFAELIEASIPDITRPDAADLLEVAQNIQITRTAGFSSDKRLRSGTVKFHYVEDDNASAGDLEIPQTIGLRIAPYIGVDPIDFEARFIYRMNAGKLKLGFVIDRLEELLLEVREELADAITVGTDIKPFAGTPRS